MKLTKVKINTQKTKSQADNVISCRLSDQIKSNPTILKEILTLGAFRLLQSIVSMCCSLKKVNPGQQYLGDRSNLVRETVNRYLPILEELNLIEVDRDQPHRQPLVYRLGSFFCPITRERLAHLFPCFLKFAVGAFLVFAGNKLPEHHITPFKNKACKDLSFILKKSPHMNESMLKLMYKKNPIPINIQNLPDDVFTLEQKVSLVAFDSRVIDIAAKQFEKYRNTLRNAYNWFYYICLKESDYLGVKPNFGWAEHLATMIPLFRRLETVINNQEKQDNSVRDKSVRTEGSTAIAAHYPSTDSKQRGSIRGKGSHSYTEWQGHPNAKPGTSLSESAIQNNALAKELKRLFNIDIR